MSYIVSGVFPTIAGRRIPQHYYILLYPYLSKIWSKTHDLVGELCVIEAKKGRDLVVKCGDRDKLVDVLVSLHTSFFTVNGWFDGELVERRRYATYLLKNYRPRLSKAFMMLSESIDRGDYESGYRYALEAIRVISEAERFYMEVGGRLNQLYFEMLYGGIPVTYTNTWRLVEEGSDLVKNIAPRIYSSVREEAYRVSKMLSITGGVLEKDRIGDKE